MNDIIDRLFELANISLNNEEFPVSAIIYDDDYKIIGEGYNRRNTTNITFDHAEIIAIGEANKTANSWRLDEYNMIVTLEPCDMCKNIIKESRLKKVEYIIPRLNYKYLSKKTKFEKFGIYDNEMSEKVTKYKQEISAFFVDKR